jgi:hypothetical protein
MCITHTARYASCNHVHSYTELVHENAIYCPDQQVAHDGITKSQDKCPDCAKTDQERLRSMEGDRKDDGSDLCRTKTRSTRVEDGGEGLQFVEDYFADGSQAYVPRDWDGGAMWSSNEEWQLVQRREPERQEIAGREDEMVVVDHEGEVMNEPLHVVGESEWMTRGQILSRPITLGDQEPNTEGTGQERMPELGTGLCVGGGGGWAAEAGQRGRDPPTSATELVWGKQEEQNGTKVWKQTWRMTGHGSWVKEQ